MSIPSGRFDEFWAIYPRRVGRYQAEHDWFQYVTTENEDSVFACLDRYLSSSEVASGAVMSAGSTGRANGWIYRCHQDNWECAWPTAQKRQTPTEMLMAELGCGE